MHLPTAEITAALRHNSPAILTGVAVAGTAITGFLAAKGGYKAAKRISYEEHRLGTPLDGPLRLSNKERARIIWPLFMPAAGAGLLTISCVLGAHHVGSKRVAALAGAYTLSEKAFSEYKEKVVETIGKGKELKVRDEIAQDNVTANPPTHNEIHILPENESLCYESMTGRYFTTTSEALRKAQNDFNHVLLNDMHASLNDYWDLIGLSGTTVGDELGWTSDHLLEIHVTTTLDPKGKPCLSLGYVRAPIANYWKFR